jgi:hypothetical protein
MTANRAASIRARLKQRADAAKQDLNLVLTRYGLERLLYRLSISEHAPNFLLKGALLFQLWYGVSILGMTNSRMKDFFDLWVLLRDPTLQGAEVRRAIEATFARRQTALPDTLPVGLRDTFANDGAAAQRLSSPALRPC